MEASHAVLGASNVDICERTGDLSFSQEALHFLHEYLADKSSQNVTFYSDRVDNVVLDPFSGAVKLRLLNYKG